MTLVTTRGVRPVLLAVAAALIVAAPSILGGFTLDDQWIVERYDVVHDLSEPGAILRAPFWPGNEVLPQGAMWRPVALFAFACEWAVGGGSPTVFHAVSILLYAVVAGLVAWIGARLFGAVVGGIAGLLFAVHPVHVEVSANVVGQAELLAAAVFLGALGAVWYRSAERRTARQRLVALLAIGLLSTLAIGAKEHVVVLPGAMVLIWWWRARCDGLRLVEVARREWSPLVLVSAVFAIYVVVRAMLLQGATHAGAAVASGLDPDSAWQRATVMLAVSLQWLRVLFFPLNLSADYSPQHLVADPVPGVRHAVALVIWAAIGLAAWRGRRRLPALPFGVALFGITVAIVSNVAIPLEVLFAERLMFLPSVGWAVAVAALGHAALAGLARRRNVVLGVIGVIALLLGVRSVVRAGVWRSNDVLFAQMLVEAPNSFRGHWARGSMAFAAGDSVTGEREMMAAVRFNPDHAQLLEELGGLYAGTGRYPPAIPLLDRAVQLDSNRIGAAATLALSLVRLGRAPEAVSVIDAMRRIHGERQVLLVIGADARMAAGDTAGAVVSLRRAVERDPAVWRLRVLLGSLALDAGECDLAAAQEDAARSLISGDVPPEIAALAGRLANRNRTCK